MAENGTYNRGTENTDKERRASSTGAEEDDQ